MEDSKQMKIKLLSLMLTLTVLITLLGVAVPASAAVKTAVQTPEAEPSVLPGPYDDAYVSLTGSDVTGTGVAGNPWRTITHAVEMLPYDADPDVDDPPGSYEDNVDREDPPGSTPEVPDRILVYQTGQNRLPL